MTDCHLFNSMTSTHTRGSLCYFGRDIDYLEDLGAKLRNLKGYATLANELLQNADDVPGVTSFAFDIRDDALVVENEGRFSDCGEVEQPECPWKNDPARGSHRCDFHRFRRVAGGDKRNESGTTGAFGIGFIAVYQITDRPEVISGRHWILDESQPGDKRITQCPGCERCRSQTAGTRFYLPWASDPKSLLRTQLRAEPTTPETPGQFLAEVERSLPTAMLFLKNLEHVEIRRNGKSYRKLERTAAGDTILLNDGGSNGDRVWHVVRGDFLTEAETLKAVHNGRIEPKRSAQVLIAIPESPMASGFLCATLPTQQKTNLPFHINADFFPAEDRKRVILEHDYQGEWNLAALKCAARTLAQSIDALQPLLGHRMLWELIAGAHLVAQEAGKDRTEDVYSKFWKEIAASIRDKRIIFTTLQQWKTPKEVFYLLQELERPALPHLEKLELAFVHEDLRTHQNVLISKEVGIRTFGLQDLVDTLRERGLTVPFPAGSWPSFAADPAALHILWQEIELLWSRRGAATASSQLPSLSLAVDRGGTLRPCTAVYLAEDDPTEALFLRIDASLPFASAETKRSPLFSQLCPAFGPAEAARVIAELGPDEFASAVARGAITALEVVAWFADHRAKILKDSGLKAAVAALPIYPSAGGLHPLARLSLPGDFSDPLQLAAVLDVEALPDHHGFLRELGIQELTFPVYVAGHLVPALNQPDLVVEKRRGAVRLLARRRSEVSEDENIQRGVAAVPLVECRDAGFRQASKVYLPDPSIAEVLGESAAEAVLPIGHEQLFGELYSWAGAETNPRFPDIVERVRALVATAPDSRNRAAIQRIFGHLSKRALPEGGQLDALRKLAWLPARQDFARWYRPEEVYATFQDYLFATQASFLDVETVIQQSASNLMASLGIRTTPPVEFVVGHLLQQADKGEPINREVYRFLNDKSDDPALLKLQGRPCLLLAEGSYVSARHVFWGEHPFGRFRRRLGEGLRSYDKLLKRLGVRETPATADAISVIRELSEAFGPTNQPLDEEAHSVCLNAWKMLDDAAHLEGDADADLASLGEVKCIPNVERVLYPPSLLFFEDRSGLAAKFGGFLARNTIPRSIGAVRAMGVAGVRALSAVVEVDVLECLNPAPDPTLTERVLERRLQMARVLMALSDETRTKEILEHLAAMRFERAELIRISCRLRAFGQDHSSEPEDCPALYQDGGDQITYCTTKARMPWASIAREMALALDPDAEAGRIAPGLKEVLAAETLEDAALALDELGLQPLEDTAEAPLGGTAPIEGLGGEAAPGPDGVPVQPAAGDGGALGGGTGPEARTNGRGEPPPNGSPISGRGGSSGGGGTGPRKPGPRQPHRGRMRSYVIKNPKVPEGDPDPSKHERNSEVGAAGVAKVMEFERSLEGVTPTEMPINHPGYDIESRDVNGEIIRYIEVKSMSGPWGEDGVGLTATEFAKAQELREKYWLYVVERALEPDARIYFIQDPASKVDEFRFDSGWQQAAEIDPRKLLPEEDW